jgi:hypothetical protein
MITLVQKEQNIIKQTWGVSLCCGLSLRYFLKHFKAKEEELWKLKYFTMQKYNLQKIL